MAVPLDPRTHVGRVGLSVADLDRSIAFYTSAIGLDLLAPAVAQAARTPAADVAKPRIRWVHVLQAPAPDGVAVEVLVHHAPLGAPATGTQVAGTVTVILSRFEGDRNHTIAGGTAGVAGGPVCAGRAMTDAVLSDE